MTRVLFVCVHNAGRSQMALGWFTHLAAGRARALSRGSEPASEVNPAAVAAMAEVGIDIAQQVPLRWSDADLEAADVVVTMGCGDTCPYVPGTRYEDWPIDDPANRRLVRQTLELMWSDNRQAWELGPEGTWIQRSAAPDEPEVATHRVLVEKVWG